MTNADSKFAGAIPDVYDDYLVPLIFEGYARELAERVARDNPLKVLETAAGSGVVTRALAPLLPADAAYRVTDLNPPMLARAQSKQPADDRLTWQTADALALPFEDDHFDALCCQFGVMFFPDRVAGYKEARRVLRGGARFHFNLWDEISENDFADEVTKACAVVFPDNPPSFLARTPHGHHNPALVRQELEMAGFSDISIEHIARISVAPTPRDAAVAYCQGTPLRTEIEHRDPNRLEEATNLSSAFISRRFGKSEVTGKIQALVVSARA